MLAPLPWKWTMTPLDAAAFCAGNHIPVRPTPSADLKRTSSHLAPTRSGRSCRTRSGWRNTFVQPASAAAAKTSARLMIEDRVESPFPMPAAEQELGAQGLVPLRRPVEAQPQAVVGRLVAER